MFTHFGFVAKGERRGFKPKVWRTCEALGRIWMPAPISDMVEADSRTVVWWPARTGEGVSFVGFLGVRVCVMGADRYVAWTVTILNKDVTPPRGHLRQAIAQPRPPRPAPTIIIC